MFYTFEEKEYPFQVSTMLRYLCKSTILRRQFEKGERVTFTPETVVTLVVPTNRPGDVQIDPYITATCPVSGCELRLNVELQESRGINNRNDAIAYLRRVMCREAIMVSERDIHNINRYGERKHYTRQFFLDQIERYRFRIDTFHSYNYSVSYD